MRDIGNEVAADGFQAADARQILHQQEASACVLIGNDNQLKELAARRKFPPIRSVTPCSAWNAARPPPTGDDGPLQRWCDGGDRGLEQFPCGRVGKLNQAVCIHDQEAVGHLIEHGSRRECSAFKLASWKRSSRPESEPRWKAHQAPEPDRADSRGLFYGGRGAIH